MDEGVSKWQGIACGIYSAFSCRIDRVDYNIQLRKLVCKDACLGDRERECEARGV